MTHIETLRFGVAALEVRVAQARTQAEASPHIARHWVELDRAAWALSDMRVQLEDAEHALRGTTWWPA